MSGGFTFAHGAFSRPTVSGAADAQISGNLDATISESPTVAAPRGRRTVGRPSQVADLGPSITNWLATEPTLSGAELFRRARERGYRGGKSALYELVRRLRSATSPAQRGPEATPGVYAALEFMAADVHLAAEGRKRVVVLVGELVWSGFVHVALGFHADTATTMRCLGDVLAAFGGAPLAMHWVSPRLVAQRGPDEAIVWTPALARLALHTGCALRLQPHDGRGRPQRTARALKTRVLAVRRFQDRADLDVRLRKWAAEMNRRRDRGRDASPAEMLREEQSRLLPCPEIVAAAP